jgi:hypothetical protein
MTGGLSSTELSGRRRRVKRTNGEPRIPAAKELFVKEDPEIAEQERKEHE